jgi:hypothetical protein
VERPRTDSGQGRGLTVACLAILLLVIIGAAIFASLHLRRVEAKLAEALARQKMLGSELQRVQAAVVGLRQGQSSAGAKAEPPAVRVPMANLGDLMAKDPALAQLFIKSLAARFDRNYGPLCRDLNLAPDQVEKLKRIRTAWLAQRQDIYDAASLHGIPEKDPSVVALLNQAQDQEKADELSLLGAAGVQQLQNYERMLPVRSNFVQTLAGTVAFTDPLSADQADQMAQTIANASPSYQKGLEVADIWTGGNIDWATTDAKLQAILTPGQFSAWQQNPSRLRAQLENAYNKAMEADAGAESVR